MSEKIVHELLAAPVGLNKIDVIDNYPIYSSDMLKEKFNIAIANLKSLRPCYNKIVSLVKEGKIIPCVSYSGFLSYIVKKTISHKSNIVYQGAYALDKDVIYIVADMKFKDFLKVDEHMASILLHELMHYCSRHNPGVFYSIFKSEYVKFYRALFQDWAGADITNKQAEDITRYAMKNFELEKDTNFVHYARFLDRLLSTTEFNGRLNKKQAISIMIDSASTLYQGFSALVRKFRGDEEVRRLIETMYNIYITEFGIRDPDTTPIQELIYPSEIPAISSQRPNNLHYSAINRIA